MREHEGYNGVRVFHKLFGAAMRQRDAATPALGFILTVLARPLHPPSTIQLKADLYSLEAS